MDAAAYGVNPHVTRQWTRLLRRYSCCEYGTSERLLFRENAAGHEAGNVEYCIRCLSCCVDSPSNVAPTVSDTSTASTFSKRRLTTNTITSTATTVDNNKRSPQKQKVESVNALGWRCSVSDFEIESDFIEPQLMSEPLDQINEDKSEWNDAL